MTPSAADLDSQKRLGELLLELGFIDAEQLRIALTRQRQWGKRLGWVLVESGFITEGRLVRGLSRQLKLDTCDPVTAPVPERLRQMVGRDLALEHRVVPIALRVQPSGEVLLVATADPLNRRAEHALLERTGRSVRWLLSGETEIDLALARHYGTRPPSLMPKHDLPYTPLPAPDAEQITHDQDRVSKTAAEDRFDLPLLPSADMPEATESMVFDVLAGPAQWVSEDVTVAGFSEVKPPVPRFGGSAAPQGEDWSEMFPSTSGVPLPWGETPRLAQPALQAPINPNALLSDPGPLRSESGAWSEPPHPAAVDAQDERAPIPELVSEPQAELQQTAILPAMRRPIPRSESLQISIEEDLDGLVAEPDSRTVEISAVATLAAPPPVPAAAPRDDARTIQARAVLARVAAGIAPSPAESAWLTRLFAALLLDEEIEDDQLTRALAKIGLPGSSTGQ